MTRNSISNITSLCKFAIVFGNKKGTFDLKLYNNIILYKNGTFRHKEGISQHQKVPPVVPVPTPLSRDMSGWLKKTRKCLKNVLGKSVERWYSFFSYYDKICLRVVYLRKILCIEALKEKRRLPTHFLRILQWWGKTAKGPTFLALPQG